MRTHALLATILLSLGVNFGFALDKKALEDHIKKAFNIEPDASITIGDPAPSQFEGLLSVPVTIGSYQQTVFLSKDERWYIWGTALDQSVDPDKERWSRLSPKSGFSKGPASAPVTVVEFSDIQCPNCQKAHQEIDEKLLKDFPNGKVRLVFRHFPLTNHDWAEPAAVAAECAGRQGSAAFWKMTGRLYGEASTITASTLRERAVAIAKDIKLNSASFNACLDDPSVVEKIKKDKQEGQTIGVNATPSFVVNGRIVRGNRYEDLKRVIEEKLKDAATSKK